MSGLQTARAIRQMPLSERIPILLLLNADEMLYQDATALLDGYLVKPVTRSQLFDVIMQIFGQSVSPHPQAIQEMNESEQLQRLRNKRILLVEDNEINQLVADEMLKHLGLQVTIASNGEDGLWMLNNSRFDAVLMDIQMPGMDGYQALARLRADPRFSFEKLPVIALTAHGARPRPGKALEAGFNDYLSKPIDAQRLAAVLTRWLKKQKTDGKADGKNG